jgi:hypothetical protein
MTLFLKPETEKLISKLMERGHFTSKADVVEAAIQTYAVKEDAFDWDYINKAAQEGIHQYENGRYTSYDEPGLRGLAEDVKQRGKERLAEAKGKPAAR